MVEQVDYTYDAFDRRIAKAVDPDGEGRAQTETERFVYDGTHIALVFDGKGKQTHRYLYGPQIDQVLADETVTGAVQWALSDQQGSVRDVINNQGQLLNHIRYDSFGNITSQTNANVDFRFGYTGREFDEETGLYYYRARYYDASIGRFISEDPMGFGAGDSNLYRYVGNSATNFTDPTGNFAFDWVGAGITSAVITGAIALIATDAAQTPMSACDKKPGDNSATRAILEIITTLGIGIGTGLVKRALSSLFDDLVRSAGSNGVRTAEKAFEPINGLLPNGSGGRLSNDIPLSSSKGLDNYERWIEYAPEAYGAIRDSASDVASIARNTGLPEYKIQRIKDHLFQKQHQLDSGLSRFDPDPDIADAWSRLQSGGYLSEDIRLLNHEYFESRFESIFRTNYRTAHDAAIRSGRTWNP
jgi:RHS repeat-associated protein